METVGAYEIEDLLGRGATARVFRARHKTLHTRCALKLFSSHLVLGGSSYERFIREAKALERIAHPNVVRLIDFGVTDDGEPYLVMEWVPGQSLARHLRRGVKPAEAVRIAAQIAGGLSAVHKAGLVHRDLKPQNVMMLEDGTAKIVDFGMVRGDPSSFPALTRADAILGTPHYMAPEQAAADRVDERSDLYALGTMLFLMLTGSIPFDGNNVVEVLTRHVREMPPKLAPAHGALGALVDALLEKDPSARPQTARELLERLRALSPVDAEPEAMDTLVAPRSLVQGNEATPISPRTMTPSDAPTPVASAPPAPRRRWAPIVWMAVASLALVAAAIAVKPSSDPEIAAAVLLEPAPEPQLTPRAEPPQGPLVEPRADVVETPKRRPRRVRRPPPSAKAQPPRARRPRPPELPERPAPPAPPDPAAMLEQVRRLVEAGRATRRQDRRYFDLVEAVRKKSLPPARLVSALEKLKRQIEANPQ